MIYLTVEQLLRIAEAATGQPPQVRDLGLLASAAARPRASAFGQDAYPTLAEKAAALLHSLARNHALVDGNKRTAFAAMVLLCGLNGRRVDLADDLAFDLTVRSATGQMDVPEIAAILRQALRRV